jgi:hypothetical protein
VLGASELQLPSTPRAQTMNSCSFKPVQNLCLGALKRTRVTVCFTMYQKEWLLDEMGVVEWGHGSIDVWSIPKSALLCLKASRQYDLFLHASQKFVDRDNQRGCNMIYVGSRDLACSPSED